MPNNIDQKEQNRNRGDAGKVIEQAGNHLKDDIISEFGTKGILMMSCKCIDHLIPLGTPEENIMCAGRQYSHPLGFLIAARRTTD